LIKLPLFSFDVKVLEGFRVCQKGVRERYQNKNRKQGHWSPAQGLANDCTCEGMQLHSHQNWPPAIDLGADREHFRGKKEVKMGI